MIVDEQPQRAELNVAALRDTVIGPSRPWRRLDVVAETGSTNADLLERSRAGEDIRGAVLAAEFQTAGRGRHGRVWSAPPRSQLAVSVGVDVADMPSESWGWLPLATGVAVVDAVAAVSGLSVGLKWPNDVLGAGRKLAGILAEVAAPAPVVVIGIGLNVTLTSAEAPDPKATSLSLLGGSAIDREALLGTLLDTLSDRVERWRAAGGVDESLSADYRAHSVSLGAMVRATLPGDQQLVGVARDIDGMGRLVIDTGESMVTVAAGDITHLRAADSGH